MFGRSRLHTLQLFTLLIQWVVVKNTTENNISADLEGQKNYKENFTIKIKIVPEKTKQHHCTICDKSYLESQHLTRRIKSVHKKIKTINIIYVKNLLLQYLYS